MATFSLGDLYGLRSSLEWGSRGERRSASGQPLGGQDGDWYCYVLASGPARITGYHRGSPEEVTAYAQNCAEDFNMRNATGKSTRAFASSKSR